LLSEGNGTADDSDEGGRFFCHEVEDIANGEGSRALKYALLGNWRSEIALLYAGRPQPVVTCAVSATARQYGLQRADFLAIIDGMEMDTRTPTFGRRVSHSSIAIASGSGCQSVGLHRPLKPCR
jgi:hypothetical protein